MYFLFEFIYKMGPNSGGGRRNKNQPQVATRARFSNWRPPVKKKTTNDAKDERPQRRNDSRNDERNEKSQVGQHKSLQRLQIVAPKPPKKEETLPSRVDENSLETIVIAPHVLVDLTNDLEILYSTCHEDLSEEEGNDDEEVEEIVDGEEEFDDEHDELGKTFKT